MQILKHFEYAHLEPEQQAISRPFAELAYLMTGKLQPCEELYHGLRALLAAKDCMVRASLEGPRK